MSEKTIVVEIRKYFDEIITVLYVKDYGWLQQHVRKCFSPQIDVLQEKSHEL